MQWWCGMRLQLAPPKERPADRASSAPPPSGVITGRRSVLGARFPERHPSRLSMEAALEDELSDRISRECLCSCMC